MGLNIYFYYYLDIEPDFKQNLLTLIPMLLKPNKLILKEIGGQKVKAKELVQYFKAYIKLFTGAELPEPKSMLVVSLNKFILKSKQKNNKIKF